MKHNLLTM